MVSVVLNIPALNRDLSIIFYLRIILPEQTAC